MAKELDLRDIYSLLEASNERGWAHVNRNNVDELITIAMEKQNSQLETKLRNWC